MKVVLLGARGQLATDLAAALRHHEILPLSHTDCDVRDSVELRARLITAAPSLVINTTAFHNVPQCETDPDTAFAVNALAPFRLAQLTRELGSRFVHVSTDYVYGGTGDDRPISEDVAPAPVQVYGVSKAAGEHLVQLANPDALIIRSSGLYGVAGASGKGGNFVQTVLRMAREKGEMRIVNDQFLSPTFTADLARGIATLAERAAIGIVHLTNSDACSWYEFACEIVQASGVKATVHPVSTAEFGAPVRRPAYSVLDNARWRTLGLAPLRPWRAAVAAYLEAKGVLPGVAA